MIATYEIRTPGALGWVRAFGSPAMEEDAARAYFDRFNAENPGDWVLVDPIGRTIARHVGPSAGSARLLYVETDLQEGETLSQYRARRHTATQRARQHHFHLSVHHRKA